MKKRNVLISTLMGAVLLTATAMPVQAKSESFSIGSTSGYYSLTKGSQGYTAKTAFGVGKEVTASRTVDLSISYTKGGKTYTRSGHGSAVTNNGNYSSTIASVTVNRPDSTYTLSGANSSHCVTYMNNPHYFSLSL